MTIELPDVNVLVALHVPEHDHHGAARAWFDRAGEFATTPVTEIGLVRLLLNPATGADATPAQALAAIDRLRAVPGAHFWDDGQRTGATARFAYALTGHRQVTDHHLLALAAHRGGRLVTLDARIEAALRPADRVFVTTLGVA